MSNFKHSFFRTLLYAQLLSGFSGVAIAAQISLSVKDRPMREVIKELEETTEYRFFYNDGIKGLNSPISVDVEDADINAVMDAIAKQANVAYVLKSGHQIVLSSVKTVQQQGNKKVTGTITDPKGEPIIGANVVVKGSTNGTITDIDGHFSIEVTPNAILQVSYIGYVAQDVPVGNKDNLVISIHEDTQKLDEVVVVGYGSQKKVNLTGAVEQVTSDVFEGRPTANATQMLEGVVPNLNISLSDGKPGRTADFNVRGAGSINGGSALVLIDGVEGDPSMLNPNDIESISVLKDAAASAIYGARAPFGVVLITTKNATEGKPKVTWSSSYSLQSPQNVPDVVSDGYIWAKHFYDAYFNYNQANPSGINKTQQFSVAWLDEYKRRHETGDFGTVISDGSIGTKGRYVYYPEGTDYYDLMYKKSVFAQNQNLSISGSDGKFDYYLSGRFYSYDGLFDSDEQTDKFKTYNMRFKGGYQLTPWLKINNNFEFSHNKYYNPITYSEGSGVVWRNIADEGHPVSYTHLDVYKRQIYDNTQRPFLTKDDIKIDGMFWRDVYQSKIDMFPSTITIQYCRTAPKVYRYNYRIQPHSLAILSKEEIPPLFKNPGIQDITDQYVVCEDIEVPLWNEKHPKEYVYLCCYDIIGWNPVCWGRPEGSKVRFPKMGVNMLYLPAYYNDGEIRPAGDAFILTREGKLRKLLPDFEKAESSATFYSKVPYRMNTALQAAGTIGTRFYVCNKKDLSDRSLIYSIENPPFYVDSFRISVSQKYRYLICDFQETQPLGYFYAIAEIKVFGGDGQQFSGEWGGNEGTKGHGLDLVTDQDRVSYYQPDQFQKDQFVVLDLGEPKQIAKVEFYPRNDDNKIVTGELYELFYWDKKWISLGKQYAEDNKLIYQNIPRESIFRIHNHTRGKEHRPFTYEGGKQVWY